ncbi:MAG TPA: hypothetical protein VFU43_16665 [Streptosporangiaceae bacterium]|nr:hypothetical protein [Streptosporangiaceae bacterium]
MIHILVVGLPLAIGLGLALLAARRGWAPRLAVSLCVGAALRIAILMIAVRDHTWQPQDLGVDFLDAANSVLAGEDPVNHLRREGGWHFLPFMAYLLAGERQLGLWLGLGWGTVARLAPVIADIALIPLTGRLAAGDDARRRALCAFQYACMPVAVMVSSIHGQFAPITLLLGVAALLAARRGRPHLAGLLIGLSVTSTSWSVLLVPGIMLLVTGLRNRLTVLGWIAAVPGAFLLSSWLVLDTPLRRLPATAKAVMSTRPVVGDWGWTAIATHGKVSVSPTLGHIGTVVLVLALLAAGWWWRRADPLTLTLVLLLVFVVVTYRFGAQYLLWPLPFLIARPTRGTWAAITAGAVWAAIGYLYTTRLDEPTWWHTHTWWSLSSLAVIALLIWALPWRRRRAGSDESAQREYWPTPRRTHLVRNSA